ADRPVQARAVPPAAARVCGLSLRRGEIADAAADQGAEDRTDERQRDGDDGADGGGDRGALGDWVFEHRPGSLLVCYSNNTVGSPVSRLQGVAYQGAARRRG